MNRIKDFTSFSNTQNESFFDKIKSGAENVINKVKGAFGEKNDYTKMIDKQKNDYSKFNLSIEHNLDTDDTEQWVRIYHESAGYKIIGQQFVFNAVVGKHQIKTIYIDKDINIANNPMIQDIIDEAKKSNPPINIKRVHVDKLSKLTKNDHEGVVAVLKGGKRMIGLIKQTNDNLSLMVFLYQTETPSSKPSGGGGIKWNKGLTSKEETLINAQVEKPYGRTPMKDVADTPGGLESLLLSVYRFWYTSTRTGKAMKKRAYATGI